MSKDLTKTLVTNIYKHYDNVYGPNWGWCSLNKAGCIIDTIDEICQTIDNPVCVEIGVYGGKSVIPAALELKRHGKGKLYGIDPWDNHEAVKGYADKDYEFWSHTDLNKHYNIFIEMIKKYECEDYVEVIKKPSDDAPLIKDIDYLYIDGQHTVQSFRDADKYGSEVKLNGYCYADDLNWKGTQGLPEKLYSMGFELIHRVDYAGIFKRIDIK